MDTWVVFSLEPLGVALPRTFPHTLLEIDVHISPRQTPRSEYLDQRTDIYAALVATAKEFSKVIVAVDIPTCPVEAFLLPCFLVNT